MKGTGDEFLDSLGPIEVSKPHPCCGRGPKGHVHHHHGDGPWYKQQLPLTIIVISVMLTVSYFYPWLEPFRTAFYEYVMMIWWAILLGFVLGGIIDHFVPQEYISKILGSQKKATIFSAVGLGFLMSACSHGILAIAIELYKKGASVPSVVAFLLAAPWANLTITIMLFAFFGVKALFLIISAIVIAIITGLLFQILDKKKMIEPSLTAEVRKGFSIRKDLKDRWNAFSLDWIEIQVMGHGILRGMWSLANMVLGWILIGMGLASLARAYVPVSLFEQYLGPSIGGILITLVAATIIEVCSEGTSPIAFEIYEKTAAFGNAFVFLMAGVVTDYTEIGLLWKNIGKKTALWMVAISVPQVLVVAYLFNMFL